MTLKSHSLAASPSTIIKDPLEGLTDTELLSLRRKIDIKLKTDLTKIDLGEELGLQYRQGMVLLESITGDRDVPANHRATVITTVSNVLSKILAEQKLVYSAERLKRFEAAFLKILQQLSAEHTRTFFDLYGDFLKEAPPNVPRETVEEVPRETVA